MRGPSGAIWRLVAIVAALVLVGALWLPWYSIRIPADVLDQGAAQFGGFGAELAQAIANLGTIHADAWDVFNATPIELLAVAVFAASLAFSGLNDAGVGGGRVITWLGLAACVISIYRLVDRPGGGSGFVHPAIGLWLELAAGITIVVSGAIVAAGSDRAF
jgi:hypothetical protein